MAGKAQGKVARRDKEVQKKRFGEKVLLINDSGQKRFCAATGAELPKKGMVVRFNGELYRDWKASESVGTASAS